MPEHSNAHACLGVPTNEHRRHLHELDVGDRFLLPHTARFGTVRRMGTGHIVVDLEGGRRVSFKKYEGTPEEEEISFVRPETDVAVAPCTVVEEARHE